MTTGDIIRMAFERKFGGPAEPAQRPPQDAPTILPPEAVEKIEKVAAQQILTEAQALPPIGPNDVAVMLAALSAMQQRGSR